MSFTVISKSDSNISGTTSKNVKITGDNNELDVKAKKDLWVAGDDNTGKVRLANEGRLAVTGSGNDFSSVNASQSTKGHVYLKGSHNTVGTYTGSNAGNIFSIRGTSNTLNNAVFGNGTDNLTNIGGTIGQANMGAGADFVGIKDAQDKFKIDGGSGSDKLWLDEINDVNNGSEATNFEKLYLKNWDNNYKVEKDASGKYTIKNGSNVLNIGSNGDALVWNGTEYKKASELAGATSGGGGTATNLTGTNGDDLFDDDKLKGNLNGGTVDGKFGKDTFIVDDSLNNATLKGGADEDIMKSALGVDDYDNISFANGKLTFKKGTNTFDVLDDVEKFQFGNQILTLDELKNHIAAIPTTANDDTVDLANAANKYKKNVDLLGGNDTVTLNANATGYTVNGNDGTADLLKLAGFNFADLKAKTSWNGSGAGISGLNINSNAISNIEKVDATGLTNAGGTAGSVFNSIQEFITWLLG
ncbi:MAG: hypothetical protein U0003_04825 [Vampirovibrionales bacterium]